MKIVLNKVPANSPLKAGSAYEFSGAEWDTLVAAGHEGEAESTVKAREASVDNAIKASKAFAPKEDTSTVRATALKMESTEAGLGVKYIQNLPVKASNLGERLTSSTDKAKTTIEFGDESVRDLVKGYLQSSEPFQKELRNGGIIRATRGKEKEIAEAVGIAKGQSLIMAKLANKISAGADFRFTEDMIRAADYTGGSDLSTANQLGVLNTGLTLQWNLGHLENQLAMLDDITTDISNTPVLFQQVARTRYIRVPGVQLKTGTNAWTGGPGNDVDVNVTMDTHAGVPISVNNNVLNATARQLLNEQKAPQLYGLGEYIIYKLVNTIINGSTRIANDGTSTSTIKFNPAYTNGAGGHTFSVAGATLPTFVADLPAAMDESKFPGGDEDDGTQDLARFAWVHTRVYAGATADTNFILNSSLQGIRQNTGENLIATGRFTRIGNIKFRKSQLMTDQIGVTGSGADGTTNAIFVNPGTFSNATTAGFAGTRSALLFVSRVPLDYTKVLPEIPSTAAVELVSSPKLGITFMVVKFLDHSYETANMRVQLMFGFGIGDERQGMLLNVK